MSELENLIDLSVEEDSENERTPLHFGIRTKPPPVRPLILKKFISPSKGRQKSLGNNPFDSAFHMAQQTYDPFETMEQEARLKANSNVGAELNIRLENLLSLSDDNIKDDVFSNSDKGLDPFENKETISCSELSIYHSALELNIDNESPPIGMLKMTPDFVSGSGSGSDDAGGIQSASSTDGSGNSGGTTKIKKALEYRKRLLKLSISNSTFNSPLSHFVTTKFANERGCLVEGNSVSPISSLFSEAALSDEQMLELESPLKFAEDDADSKRDIKNQYKVQSDKDFEADLEMLTIPILKELHSPIVENSEKQISLDCIDNKTEPKPVADLSAIRAQLKKDTRETIKPKNTDNNSNQDITQLIHSLKSLISDIDKQKKDQVDSLLETLSFAFAANNENKSNSANEDSSSLEPQPIVRQSTFDLDLQTKSEHLPDCSDIREEDSPRSNPSTLQAEEIPDVMLRSSATYDGETAAEKGEDNLQLPEVEPLDVTSGEQKPDVNDIIEQLTKILGQQQLHTVLSDTSKDGGGVGSISNSSSTLNPTFIVVMNTTQLPGVQDPSTDLSHNTEEGSSGLIDPSAFIRGRSQSLSIHDKIKIVQLPLKSPVQLGAHAAVPDASTNQEFKTPIRPIMRRNSICSTPPCTPTRTPHGSSLIRRSNGMPDSNKAVQFAEQKRQQERAVVHPMPFQIDLKKKTKKNSSSESILKSSRPLKATIPVKKVAPLLKADYKLGSKELSSKFSRNSSMHMLNTTKGISYTSTPMPASRTAVGVAGTAVRAGLANASFTPMTYSSPLRNTGAALNQTVSKTNLSRRSLVVPRSKDALVSNPPTVASRRPVRLSLNAGKTIGKPSDSRTSLTGRPNLRTASGNRARDKENKQP